MSEKENLLDKFLEKSLEKGMEYFTNKLKEKTSGVTNLLNRYDLNTIKLIFKKEQDKWSVEFENDDRIKEVIKDLVITEMVNRLNEPAPYNYTKITPKDVRDIFDSFIVRF